MLRLPAALYRTAPLLVLAPLALAPAAPAQSDAATYYRAYYLEHEEGDLRQALELYREVLRAPSADPELAAGAERAVRRLSEDLAASDLAALVPPETIIYAELNRPGDQLGSLLDQLGILGAKGAIATDRFAVSPYLLHGALGLRGAAVAVTALDGNAEPKRGVAILHPGRQDILRGLVDTLLPASGKPIQPIRGRTAWNVDDEMIVALGARLVVLGTDRNGVDGVFARLDGDSTSSLAQSTPMRETLGGPSSLFGIYVQAEPIRPLLRLMADQAVRQDPDMATALELMDVESLESLSARVGVEPDGLQVDMALQLAEGHQNLAFNLLRLPGVGPETLAQVPEGAAFFLAGALNRHAPVTSGIENEAGEPIVTLMDFGREFFANAVDVTVFGLPPEEGADAGPLPEVAALVRANDVTRSRALWNFVLGVVSSSTPGGSMQPAHEAVAGYTAERYTVEGVPLYLVELEHGLLLSPSRSAVHRVLTAHAQGRSVLDDEAYAKSLAGMQHEDTLVLVASPGRVAEMALPLAPAGEADELALMAQMMRRTTFVLGVEQSANRLSLRACLRDVPDVSRFVLQMAGNATGAPGGLAGAR